jgi:hypothetical protein
MSYQQQQGPVELQLNQEQDLLPLFSNELQQPRKLDCLDTDELLQLQQAPDVDPKVVNTLLQQLQGRSLDYYMYARQVKNWWSSSPASGCCSGRVAL